MELTQKEKEVFFEILHEKMEDSYPPDPEEDDGSFSALQSLYKKIQIEIGHYTCKKCNNRTNRVHKETGNCFVCEGEKIINNLIKY